MTTLAVLADIHGNLPALSAVRTDLAQFNVDQVVVAGDVINWGPFSAEVTERVVHEGWAVIRGNNEFYLLDHDTPRAAPEWNDPAQYPMIPWLSSQLGDRWRNAIAAWPDGLSLRFRDAPALRIAHGTPRSPWEPIYPQSPPDEIDAMLGAVEESTLVVAHTHLPMERRVNGWHILNPGSVGLPLDGLFSASYLLLEGGPAGWRATFRRVPFDYAPLYQEFERQGFVETCGVIGRLALEEFRTARLQLLPFLNWRQAARPGAALRPELLAEYAGANYWDYVPAAYRPLEQAE